MQITGCDCIRPKVNYGNFYKTKSNSSVYSNQINKLTFDTVSFGSQTDTYQLESDKYLFGKLLKSPDLFTCEPIYLKRSFPPKRKPSIIEQAYSLAEKIDRQTSGTEARQQLLDKFFEQDDNTIFRYSNKINTVKFDILQKLCNSLDEDNKNTDKNSILFERLLKCDDDLFIEFFSVINSLAAKTDKYNNNHNSKKALVSRLVDVEDDKSVSYKLRTAYGLAKTADEAEDTTESISRIYKRLINAGDGLFFDNFDSVFAIAKEIDGKNKNTYARGYLFDNMTSNGREERLKHREKSVTELAFQIDKANGNTSKAQKLEDKWKNSENGTELKLAGDCHDFIWFNKALNLDYDDFQNCSIKAWAIATNLDENYSESTMISDFMAKITEVSDDEFLSDDSSIFYVKIFSEKYLTHIPVLYYGSRNKKYDNTHTKIIDRLIKIKNDDWFLKNAEFIQSYAEKLPKDSLEKTKMFIGRLKKCNDTALLNFINIRRDKKS